VDDATGAVVDTVALEAAVLVSPEIGANVVVPVTPVPPEVAVAVAEVPADDEAPVLDSGPGQAGVGSPSALHAAAIGRRMNAEPNEMCVRLGERPFRVGLNWLILSVFFWCDAFERRLTQ
jgi:hypothetical protein